MSLAHEKLSGLDRDRVLGVVEPVLVAHNVEGVELVWGTDRGGRVLRLSVERPESRIPGAGVTLELCSEISRDLSAALDAQDLIPASYRLEVGSPGLDRALYRLSDYSRFAGQLARIKLREARDGQRVLRGVLQGLEQSDVLLDTERGVIAFPFAEIQEAHLVFDWNAEKGGSDKGGSDKGRSEKFKGRAPGKNGRASHKSQRRR